MSSIDIDPLLGRTLADKFEIRELLGVGAMGKVYRAHHLGLDKAVAIKVLIRAPAAADAQARRFRREARAASRLEHPNTVRILDFGEATDGLLYIAMEYLEGPDLQAKLTNSGPMDPRSVTWVMSQVFSALAAAHAKDVIHRDIKPGNIMLVRHESEDGPVEDFVKVCDFGLAKILDNAGASMTETPLTAQGAVFGTPAYMSPEQAKGDALDARSDIYSCGVVMYKMMVGHAPFRAENPTGVLIGHIYEPPPPLSSWGLPIHPGLARIVERAMEKAPEARFQTALEARDALRSLLDSEGWSRPPATSAGSLAPPPRRPTDIPTEQVRLRKDQAPTMAEVGADATVLDRPAVVAEDQDATVLAGPAIPPDPTRYLDTIAPAERAPPTLPAPAPVTAARTPWWAIVPGAVALLAAGGLVVVLLSRRGPERTAPPAVMQQAPKPLARTSSAAARGRRGDAPPPAEAASPEARSAAVAAQPDLPSGSTATSPTPSPTSEARGHETAPPGSTRAMDATSAKAPAPIAPRRPELRTAPMPPKVVLTLSDVQLFGALSRQRCQEALTRHLDDAAKCLEPIVGAVRAQTAGKLRVEATIDERGKLRHLESKGLGGSQDCLEEAFGPARLPPADTGMVGIRFVLRYRTVLQ